MPPRKPYAIRVASVGFTPFSRGKTLPEEPTFERALKAVLHNIALDATRMRELRDYLLDEWAKLAKAEVDQKYQAQYIDGMKSRPVGDNSFELYLAGFDAASVELGWAPPLGRGKLRRDGLGEYTGAAHDMRSYMMGKTDGVTKDGEPFRIIPMEEPRAYEELQATAEASVGADAAKAFMGALRSLPEGRSLQQRFTRGFERRSQEMDVLNSDTGEFYRGTRKHKFSREHRLYRRTDEDVARAVKAGKAGTRLSKFRVIADNADQKARHLWFTKGVPPARLFKKLMPIVKAAVANMMNGKSPKGT